MNKSKLVEIYYSLSKPERNQLAKFILSPFHNQNPAIADLLNYLNQQKSADSPKLQRELVFHHIFPKESFNDLKFRHLSSDLLKLIEDFLVWKEMQSDDQNRAIYLLRALRSRQLDKSFDAGYNATAKSFQNSEVRDLNYHYCHYQLLSEKYNYTDNRSIEVHPLLQEISDELDIYFIINKLKQACNMLSHQRVFKTSYNLGLVREIISYIHSNQLDKIPEVGIYYCAYNVLEDESETHFLQLKQKIAEYHQTLRQEEMRDMYLLAINYCIKRLNDGASQYTREVFEIYKDGIENKVLFENGILSPFTYKNVVAAALKLQETQWTEEFIEAGKEHLPVQYQDSFYIYNKAKLNFARKQYKEVSRSLNTVEIEDLFTNIDAKVTLIKTYFEMNEFERLDYLLDNFVQLIRRRKLMAYHQSNYATFISFVKKLTNLKSFDPKRKKKLRQEIMDTEILTEREWLISKLDEA